MKTLFVSLCSIMMSASLLAAGKQARTEDRLFYVHCNFGQEASVENTLDLVSRAAAAGYNGMVLAGALDRMAWWTDKRQFERVRRIRRACEKNKVELIPLIWSCGYGTMQNVDPNLAEGLPMTDVPAVVKKGELVFSSSPVPASKMTFHVTDKNVKGTGPWTFSDFTPPSGHSRASCHLDLRRNRRYRATIRVRSDGLQPLGSFKLQGYVGLGEKSGSRHDFFTSPLLNAAKGETVEFSAEFMTQDRPDYDLVFGTWGGKSGAATVESLSVVELPPDKPLRRPGCPYSIRLASTGKKIDESRLSRERDGMAVLVNCYVAARVGASQVSTCMSEPKLYELFEKSAAALAKELGSKSVFLSMDEIRAGGTCEACRARKTDMAHILGDCVTRQCAILRKRLPGVRIFIWSDMFNPNVNAVDGYFACRGSYKGSWKLIPKDVVIADWNGPRYEKSLPFWKKNGFKVLGATYYDTDALAPRSTHDVAELRKYDNVTGLLYTTWRNKYELLEPFAREFFKDKDSPKK